MPQRRFSFDWLTRGTPWIVKVVRKPLGSLNRFSAPNPECNKIRSDALLGARGPVDQPLTVHRIALRTVENTSAVKIL
jgi:hypothetical protein